MSSKTKNISRPLKVLMVTGSYPPQLCGVGDYAYRLARFLAADGCLVTVVASGDPRDPQKEEGVIVRRVMGNWSLFHLPRFLRVLGEESPDIVHFQYPSRGYGWHLLPNLLPLILRIVRPDVPVVTTLHEYEGAHPLRKASYVFFTLFSRRVFVPAAGIGGDLSSGFPWVRRKIRSVTAGPFLDSTPLSSVHRQGRGMRLVFTGFLNENKGPEEAVRALAILKEEFPRLTLRFASDQEAHAASRHRLERLTSDLGVDDRVRFLGRMEGARMVRELEDADLVVLPFHDGASTRRTSLITALAFQCPVVTTDGRGVIPEFREGGVLLCQPKDPASLAHAIRTYLKDPDVRRTIRSRVRHLAALFSWERIAKNHRALYGEVLGDAR